MTRGVISKKMTPNFSTYSAFQMDTYISGGNSGGPLVDENGFVVGINSAGIQASGIDIGMNYAIVTDELTKILDSERIESTLAGGGLSWTQPWFAYVFLPIGVLALAGGIYAPEVDAFDTTSSLNLFSNMFFDYYFMGINGISKANGCTCTLQDSANRMPVKRLMASHSQSTIVLCDHTKINKTYMHGICKLSEVSLIITDDGCTPEERQSFQELGTPVVFAPIG